MKNTFQISKGRLFIAAAVTGTLLLLASCSGSSSLPVAWSDLELQADGNYFFKRKPFTGKTFQNYDNGKKKFEVDYVEGKETGKYISWFENGTKEYEGSSLNGKTHGKCTYWTAEGKLASEEMFSNGMREGLSIIYDENGKKDTEQNYHEDKLVGKYVDYYPDGKKRQEGSYIYNPEKKGSDLDGLIIMWREDGTKDSEQTYKNGKLNGPYTIYHLNGKIAEKRTYVDDKLTENQMFDDTGKAY